MAVASVTVTNAELLSVLMLSTTDVVDFDIAAVDPAALVTAAEAYVALVMNKSATFEPFGRQLRRFANTQVGVLRAEVIE